MKPVSVPLHIRYRDMDMNHHVNNAVYFTYMENARTAVLMDEMMQHHEEGYQLVVSEASCKFKRPIELTHEITCELSFLPVRATSFDIFYVFRNIETGDIHAEGNTRMVLFNGNTGRPMAIPDWFTDKYLK